MATDTRKVILGSILLVVSSVIILGTGQLGSGFPVWAASIAALGMAAGALFVGTSEDARAV